MKKVFFDFTPFQDKNINGGALYTKTVMEKMVGKCIMYGYCLNINELNSEILLYAKNNNISIYEYNDKFNDTIDKLGIDVMFIGISQRYNKFDLTGIKCNIFVVCHDLVDFSLANSNTFYDYDRNIFTNKICGSKHPKLSYYKFVLKRFLKEKTIFGKRLETNKLIKRLGYSNFEKLIESENVYLITVSEYSKHSLLYYFPNIVNEIKVLYPPVIERKEISTVNLDSICQKPYFLIISANRYSKNSYAFLKIFERWNLQYDNKYACVVVGIDDVSILNSVCIKKVSDSELKYLFMNCYSFVYPSLGEGFGYPPIEAMEYSKPVVAAFDTSISEICSNSAVFFNPIYEEDMFISLNKVVENYEEFEKMAQKRYKEVSSKQNEDLNLLVEYILK